MNVTTEHYPGPLEVGYPTLLSGFEKPVVQAMQTVGINLASEPVCTIFTGSHTLTARSVLWRRKLNVVKGLPSLISLRLREYG